MINYNLKEIKAIIFDVDGVLSAETITMSSDGEPLRTANIKDGYAIQLAQKLGLKICIITGGKTEAVGIRYHNLGVKDIYLGAKNKIEAYETFISMYGFEDKDVLYMGDDIPDHEVMKRCGCPCCPADACPEIKRISLYISHNQGGYGCGRDVIEQVLKAQDKWLLKDEAFGW